jgi:membrane-bound serine protease (ClpP class)
MPGFAAAKTPNILIVTLEGSISPMSSELVNEALNSASASGTPVILVINTPGGNLDATFNIIEALDKSDVPVIGYVFPAGSKAWSAGTYILLSTNIAAMAPHTIIGSAQPVLMDPLGGAVPIEDPKVLNALDAFLVEKAHMHGRNETASRLFVLDNLNLSAEEAMEKGVIEIVASSIDELIEILDGTIIETVDGPFTLKTLDAETVQWSPSLRITVLQFLSEPMLSYLLFIIGIYALIFGVTSPGYGGEVLGAIFVILGIIGMGITGVNIGAIILLGIGVIFLLAELFSPGFGIFGGGGLFSMLVGGMLLIPAGPWIVSQEWLNTLRMTILLVPLIVGVLFIFAAYKILKSRKLKPFIKGAVGGIGESADDLSPKKVGFVLYQGEYWKVKTRFSIKRGTKVKILKRDGMLLTVEPIEETVA